MSEQKETSEKQGSENEFSAPTESIENCVAIVEKLYNAKADSIITAEEVWAITGPRGTMGPKISACIQYGLVENNPAGKGYRTTDFGVSIIRPEFTDENFVKKKLLEVFNRPVLYKRLIERYNSKSLPNQKGLANLLVTEYGFNANSTAPRAANVFLTNCSFVNVDDGGRLKFFIPNVTVTDPKDNGNGTNNGQQPPPKKEEEVKDDETIILIPLKQGEKRARLILPNGFDSKDLTRIAKFVEALKDDE